MTNYPINQVISALNRIFHGDMYISEFVGYSCHQLAGYFPLAYLKRLLFILGNKLRVRSGHRRLMPFFDGEKFDFNGAFLPDVRLDETLFMGLSHNYNDIYKVHCEKNGDYCFSVVDPCDDRFPEGPYFYQGPNGEDIRIQPGDVVVDAGAWIGDFSAIAACLAGPTGKVYAFEPSPELLQWLRKTGSYFSNLQVVPFGLGDKNENIRYHDDQSGGGTFLITKQQDSMISNIVCLDDWVKENNIDRLNFIKADIEGYERNMLIGAKLVLRDLAPTLSICTYHLKDDPNVLEDLIRKFNPDYRVIQRKHKLFAYIPSVDK